MGANEASRNWQKEGKRIYEAAQTSVGCTTGINAARMELQILSEDYG